MLWFSRFSVLWCYLQILRMLAAQVLTLQDCSSAGMKLKPTALPLEDADTMNHPPSHFMHKTPPNAQFEPHGPRYGLFLVWGCRWPILWRFWGFLVPFGGVPWIHQGSFTRGSQDTHVDRSNPFHPFGPFGWALVWAKNGFGKGTT